MSKPLQGKYALVTGASRGIGRAVAEALARDGATVALHYGRNRAAAAEALAAVQATGAEGFLVEADLAERGAVGALFAALDAELARRSGTNRFDILVNNAAIAPWVKPLETAEDVLDQIYTVNFKAPFLILQEAAKRLNTGGKVINVSSVVARLPIIEIAAYSALKAALNNLTAALAVELGERGITVNAVAPGAIETDMSAFLRTEEGAAPAVARQALKRVGKPQDVADAVAFLAGPASRWITGEVIAVSGGSAVTY